MKRTIFALLLGLLAMGVAAADFDTSKTYSIKNAACGFYLSLQTSYIENNAVNATPLVAEPVYFSLTPSTDGKNFAISLDNVFVSFSTQQNTSGWNTSFSSKPAYVWEINTTENVGQYTITSEKGFLKYDGKNNYAYTDGKQMENGTSWIIEEHPENPGVAGLDYPVENLRGDMNGDGLLTMSDVTEIIDILLYRKAPQFGIPDFTGTAPDIKPNPDATLDFPQPDGSPDWYMTDKPKNFAGLLLKVDPSSALTRSMFPSLTDEQFATIKATADEVCKGCATTADKISTLNDWVYENVAYDNADNSPWVVFQKRVGICQGKANLLKVMLLTQNIPAVGVNGWYSNYAHAWTYAYDGKDWYVCDPTNAKGKVLMTNYSAYSHLKPDMADIVIFDTPLCTCNYYEGYLNVCAVKTTDDAFVVPFGLNGFRVCSFNLSTPLPANVRHLYIGHNILSLGQSIVGLRAYPGSDEMCYVDPYNHQFGSYEGVIYKRNETTGNLSDVFYIPTKMTTLRLQPMEVVEKNTVLNLESIETIIFAEGTKTLESYAVESCPALRTVYVPKDCTVQKDALYRCPNAQIVYGLPE